MRCVLLLAFLLGFGAVNAQPQYDVVLVRSDLPFDWIIAQGYAHSSGVPIVTTRSDRLDEDAGRQLRGYIRAGYNNLVILGGEQAVSREIQIELDDMGFVTHRISEGDRYGTSARAALELFGPTDVAVVVGGEGYGGLLIAHRVASSLNAPILFVKRESIPPSVGAALENMGVKKIYLVEEGVGEGVRRELGSKYEILEPEEGIASVGPGYPWSYIAFFAGIIGGAALLLIWFRAIEGRVRRKVPYTILTEDEEKIVRAILESGGELTQDKLPAKTDFSRPKISRIIADLAGRGIIVKERHGRTQKLVVSRDFYEEKEF
jgi:uncharacterized membrane protein